jgi:hypothetical protein
MSRRKAKEVRNFVLPIRVVSDHVWRNVMSC